MHYPYYLERRISALRSVIGTIDARHMGIESLRLSFIMVIV